MVVEGVEPDNGGPGMGITGMGITGAYSGISGPVGVQGHTVGVQGHAIFEPIPDRIEKLELKSGDILIIHYPENIDQSALRDVIYSLRRVNERLKKKGIDLTDIVLFKEGVRISVLSTFPTEEERPSDYRRIELL